MLEVVFNESTKASMKQRKLHEKRSSIDEISEDVLYIGGNLDIGDISGDLCSERRKVYDKLWSDIYIDEIERDKHFAEQHKDIDKLISAAKDGENIRIWKGNSPAEACGFAFVCNLLVDIECKIKVISLPEYIVRNDNVIESHIDWNSIVPKEFDKFLYYEKELTYIEKDMHSSVWEELKQENSPLRAIVNGMLISVPEEFYDHLIVKNIPEGEFTIRELIGILVGKYQLGVSDLWYGLRIKKMVDKGLLEVVSAKKPLWKYETVLRKKD